MVYINPGDHEELFVDYGTSGGGKLTFEDTRDTIGKLPIDDVVINPIVPTKDIFIGGKDLNDPTDVPEENDPPEVRNPSDPVSYGDSPGGINTVAPPEDGKKKWLWLLLILIAIIVLSYVAIKNPPSNG